MAWPGPERFFTLTLAPIDWQECRQKLSNWARTLRRDGYRWEAAWTIEAGEDSPELRHIHGLQHGDFVPQAHLQRRWGAIVHIRAVRGRKGAARYAMKEALQVAGYSTKGTSDLPTHLALNGGRGVHMTRGYLRGKTTDEVVQLLRKDRGEFTWVLVRPGVELVAGQLGQLSAAEIPPELVRS